MNILVLNGSPKGKASATLHTALYLEALHLEHTFEYLPVGVRIKSYEKDFAPARAALEKADLVLFCYPVYTFLAPYQLHRFVELMKESGPDLAGKFASQITTSKHFYDVTAHRWVEENCFDLGMKPVRGLSADMEDLLSEKGRRQARDFFDQLVFACEHGLFVTPPPAACAPARPAYCAALPETPTTGDKPAGLPLRGRLPGVHELRRHRQVRLQGQLRRLPAGHRSDRRRFCLCIFRFRPLRRVAVQVLRRPAVLQRPPGGDPGQAGGLSRAGRLSE